MESEMEVTFHAEVTFQGMENDFLSEALGNKLYALSRV
jgi:hypothetical protein